MTNNPIQFSIKNLRNLTENGKELNFAISSNNSTKDPVTIISSNATVQISADTSFPLSVFTGGTMEIGMNFINSGRLYFGYGTLPTNNKNKIAPIPEGNQYYGWIEFSRKSTDNCVWINLSNVDTVGLPLALSASTWSLGYKSSIEDIKNAIKKSYPSAAITAGTHTVIIAPNINPAPYPSFDDYFNGLCQNNTKLCINSDTLSNGTQKQFVGSFLNLPEPHISLKSEEGDTLLISGSQLTNDIIYKGDGGTLVYNGKVVDQNQSGATDSVICANSVFRNIIIGFNEGYFEKNPQYSDGINYSLNYSFLKPFGVDGTKGSMYAKILHENSNSYGFAYADSNLKTLIQSPLNEEIEIYILKDTTVGLCYRNDEKSSINSPTYGSRQFGIGGGSQTLGDLMIGNCNYPANTTTGAYGGYLPYVDSWQKMYFGNNGYIWINCVKQQVVDYYTENGKQYNCLSGAHPTTATTKNPEGIVLQWGSGITWIGNKSADDPTKPPKCDNILLSTAKKIKRYFFK